MRALLVTIGLWLAACSPEVRQEAPPQTAARPSILLVTLDTTRADALGYEAGAAATPNLDALAARGRVFSQAYSTVPTTLPAHASMLTGLYPAGHGLHENARHLGADKVLVAELLDERGYTTAAFVSGYPLATQFGLARGFDHYDDDFVPEAAERDAGETTDRALAFLERQGSRPLFLWVHYFDPHEPYEPPEPFRSRYPEDPYLGEIAFMDSELGRLLDAFEGRPDEDGFGIVVAGDHGEGRGDHGERLHGNLLYQGVMRVPLIVAGTGVEAGEAALPVSIRRIHDTLLAFAGGDAPESLLAGREETVLGEAMRPYLHYGWQPQVMAARGRIKVIRAGDVEIYDVVADPAESENLAGRVEIDPELRRALSEYPSQPVPPAATAAVSEEDRDRLASLGYVDWEGGGSTLREGAPAPKDMTHLFADLDRGSGFFVSERYGEAIEVFSRVLEQDPHNLMVCVRLGVAHSILGDDRQALEYFEQAREIDPASVDARHYLGMHYLGLGRWSEAEPLLASVLSQMPNRLPALEGMALIRESQGRILEAAELLERVAELKPAPAETLVEIGELRMAAGDTPGAVAAFERAWEIQEEGFSHFLELGVLYLADRRPEAAAECLDRVPPAHPGYPMALFKRAQVSVLLGESDQTERIRLAWDEADAATRRLIENESLFDGVALR